jgi:hypothetical protein
MNSETIAKHIEREMAAVPDTDSSIGAVVRRGSRRRRARRAAWAIGVLGLAFLFVMFPVPYDPNPKAIAGEYEIPAAVEISDLEVAVESQTPASTDPDVWIGWMHPAPEFDTTNFGPNRTFTAGEPAAADLSDKVLSAVYLGDYEGEPFYIYSVAPPTIQDRVSEIATGNLSGEILGTNHGCCSGGDMDREEGLPGLSGERTGDEEPLITAELLGLNPNVSVVAVQVDDQFIGWQTPVGGVISMRLAYDPGAKVTLVAFTPDGKEIQRYGPWPIFDFDAPLPTE